MKIFDNALGVLTNSPSFDWHTTNLRNYIHLSAVAIPEKKIAGLDFSPMGAGSGTIGLPGDFTPPSRFVRAVAWTQTARSTQTSIETVYEVFRILAISTFPLDQPKEAIEWAIPRGCAVPQYGRQPGILQNLCFTITPNTTGA